LKGLITAAGLGTRLRPLSFSGNKHVIPIANKPLIFYSIERLIELGIKEIGVVVGTLKDDVVNCVGDGSEFGIEITYIHQAKPLGLGHAILVAEEFVSGEPFFTMLGDNLLQHGLEPQIQLFQREACDCVLALTRVDNPQRYGIVELDGDKIVRITEKPTQPKSNIIVIGSFLFTELIFDALKKIEPSWRNEIEITDAINVLIDNKRSVGYDFIHGWWKDIGTPNDVLEANRLCLAELNLMETNTLDGVSLHGGVRMGEGTIISPQATVEGPVVIGRNATIGAGSFIGPNTSLGDRVVIKHSSIQNSVVMDGAEIECRRRITASIIGKNTVVKDAEDTESLNCNLVVSDYSHLSI
jgi:glucose-1-phosphate thymidylyltransferase